MSHSGGGSKKFGKGVTYYLNGPKGVMVGGALSFSALSDVEKNQLMGIAFEEIIAGRVQVGEMLGLYPKYWMLSSLLEGLVWEVMGNF
jgi:hypothetical protein